MTEKLNDNKLNIECQWMKNKRLLINPDGQVLPCCFFANVIYMLTKFNDNDMKAKGKDRGIEDQIMDKGLVAIETNAEPVFQEYLKNKENYNIHHTPLEEIINSNWFTKTLPESWDDPNIAVRQCKKHCQIKDE